jgi:hypothetical protein
MKIRRQLVCLLFAVSLLLIGVGPAFGGAREVIEGVLSPQFKQGGDGWTSLESVLREKYDLALNDAAVSVTASCLMERQSQKESQPTVNVALAEVVITCFCYDRDRDKKRFIGKLLFLFVLDRDLSSIVSYAILYSEDSVVDRWADDQGM